MRSISLRSTFPPGSLGHFEDVSVAELKCRNAFSVPTCSLGWALHQDPKPAMASRIKRLALTIAVVLAVYASIRVLKPSSTTDIRVVRSDLEAAFKVVLLQVDDEGQTVVGNFDGEVILPTGKQIALDGHPILWRWPPPSGEQIVVTDARGNRTKEPRIPRVVAFSASLSGDGRRFVMFLENQKRSYEFVRDEEISWYFQARRTHLSSAQLHVLRELTAQGRELDVKPKTPRSR